MKNQADFTEINSILKQLSSEENFLIITEEYSKGGFFFQLFKNHLNLQTLNVILLQILEDFEYKDILEHSDGKDKFKLLSGNIDLDLISNCLKENNISKCLIHSTENFYNSINFLDNPLNIPIIFVKSL